VHKLQTTAPTPINRHGEYPRANRPNTGAVTMYETKNAVCNNPSFNPASSRPEKYASRTIGNTAESTERSA
jgi:hypothetical protein